MSANVRSQRLGIVVGIALAAGLLVLAGCGGGGAVEGRYHCPMHPTYIAEGPGDCPICGMRLVPLEVRGGEPAQGGSAPAETTEIADQPYLCPMHPEVGGDGPQDRCPKCGMRLEPRDEVLAKIGVPAAHDGHQPAAARPLLDGMVDVEVTPEGARLAGIQTAPVVREAIGRAVRAAGVVVPDESRVRHVHTKMSGFVERLYVSFIGQHVRAGEPILAIYSPQLLATQEELLRARATAARFAASELPEVRRGGEELVQAARRRLELLDVPETFIAELERTGEPQRAVTLLAPVSGFVTAKDVFEGHQVSPGMELFVITDLSRVWVEADLYEYEAAAVALGQAATITLPYDPGTVREGRVAYVYPTLDPATRTLRVRFELPNPSLVFKPGMFANVELATGRAQGLVIPDSAVMDTGTREVVFVAAGEGRFSPREVRVGVRSAGRAEILDGLAEGERVVIKANFLLDSESRMRAAFEAASEPAAASPPPAHRH